MKLGKKFLAILLCICTVATCLGLGQVLAADPAEAETCKHEWIFDKKLDDIVLGHEIEVYHCKNCRTTESRKVHVYVPVDYIFTPEGAEVPEMKETKKNTCTEAGIQYYSCSVCEQYLVEVKSKLNEEPYNVDLTEEKKDIEKEFEENGKKSEVLPALGHKLDMKDTQKTEATCTQKGSKNAKCERCKQYIPYEEIPALGHKFDTDTATCTEGGFKQCSREECLFVDEKQPVPAKGHSWEVDTEAGTCQEPGQRHCTVCSALEEIPGKHQFVPNPDATCGADGKMKCALCSEEGDVIPATGKHEFVTTLEAGCETEGSAKCTVCGETKVIPANGHTWNATVTKKATWFNDKTETRTCSTCGKVELLNEDINKNTNYFYVATHWVGGFGGFILAIPMHFFNWVLKAIGLPPMEDWSK